MAVLVYTKDNVILRRDTTNTPTLEEVVTTDSPNQIIYIGSGSNPQVISASNIAITSSWSEFSVSASYAPFSPPDSASYATFAETAISAAYSDNAGAAVTASYAAYADNAASADSALDVDSAAELNIQSLITQGNIEAVGAIIGENFGTVDENIVNLKYNDTVIATVNGDGITIVVGNLIGNASTATSASYAPVPTNIDSASYATYAESSLSASYTPVPTNVDSSSYAVTASYALNGGTGGTTILEVQIFS